MFIEKCSGSRRVLEFDSKGAAIGCLSLVFSRSRRLVPGRGLPGAGAGSRLLVNFQILRQGTRVHPFSQQIPKFKAIAGYRALLRAPSTIEGQSFSNSQAIGGLLSAIEGYRAPLRGNLFHSK